jgi:DUF971 family protein
MPARDQIEDLVCAGASGRQVLEVRVQGGREHPVQAEAEMLRVADHAPGSRRCSSEAVAVSPSPKGPLIHTSMKTTVSTGKYAVRLSRDGDSGHDDGLQRGVRLAIFATLGLWTTSR